MGIRSQQIETWVCLRMGVGSPQHSNRENDDQAARRD